MADWLDRRDVDHDLEILLAIVNDDAVEGPDLRDIRYAIEQQAVLVLPRQILVVKFRVRVQLVVACVPNVIGCVVRTAPDHGSKDPPSSRSCPPPPASRSPVGGCYDLLENNWTYEQ